MLSHFNSQAQTGMKNLIGKSLLVFCCLTAFFMVTALRGYAQDQKAVSTNKTTVTA
jgi:hypothetical protein